VGPTADHTACQAQGTNQRSAAAAAGAWAARAIERQAKKKGKKAIDTGATYMM
jgi:uncharacterized membrane protein YgdD (TMEM256/DUF423 family)